MKFLINFTIILGALIFPNKAFSQVVVKSEKNVYKKSLQRIVDSAEKSGFPSTLFVSKLKKDRLHKNKSRDNLLLVPDNFSYDYINLIIWFHGCNGFSKRTFSERVFKQASYLYDQDSSFAFAVPELPWSTNTKTRCKRLGQAFNKKGEFEHYLLDVKKKINNLSFAKHGKKMESIRIIVIGHSGGGSAINAISKTGDLCLFDIDSIVWSDASYGRWLQSFMGGCIKGDLDTEVHVVTRYGDKPHLNLKKSIKINKKYKMIKILPRIMRRSKWTHKMIGDNIIMLTDIIPSGC